MKRLALSPRTLTWVLLSSLVLNAFLLASAGMRWFKHGHGPHHGLSVELLEQRFAGRLPEADAVVFHRILAERREELGLRITSMGQTRDQLRASLAVEPFDRARLVQALDDNDRAMDALQGTLRTVILAVAPALSTEGRRRLFDEHGH